MSGFPTMPGVEIDRMVAAAATAGAGTMAEVLRFVRRGEITFVQPQERAALVSMSMLKRAPHPVLVVIGDDDYHSTGPAGWACARSLLRWSRWTCIHGAGAELQQYRDIVEATLLHRRVLLVETSSALIRDWAIALYAANPRSVGTVIVPRNGMHPIMPPREMLQ